MRQPRARARSLISVALLGLVLAHVSGSSAEAQAADPGAQAVGAPTTEAADTGAGARRRNLADNRPDIVVLMVDDVAEMDLRVWKRLPTIKHLFLDEGVRFTDYIGNNPLCCPGRANFLSGQWSAHNGVIRNDARLFDPTTSIATELHGVGYWTAIVGKYFNLTNKLVDKTPPGWDHSLVYNGGYRTRRYWVDGVRHLDGYGPSAYMTDTIADQALTWLKDVPPDDPLFLFLAPYAPHSSGTPGVKWSGYFPTPAPRHVRDRRCRGIAPWDSPSYNEPNVADKPAYIRKLALLPWSTGWPLRKVCESLLSVDAMLGRVVDELDAQGRTNVLFVLTDDNGMTFGAHRWSEKKVPYATPMPLFFHWQGHLGATPRSVGALTTNVDMAPTLCALAGCRMGPFANGHGVDGTSLLPLLDGSLTDLGRAGVLIQDHTPSRAKPATFRGVWTSRAWTDGPWMYVKYSSGERELYRLTKDPWMLNNLAGKPKWASVQADLRALLATFTL